jgi:nicotinamidase-related amidase
MTSPFAMSTEDSALLVVDMQERLLPAISGREELLDRALLLVQAARTLQIPILVTEQYPKGLGRTAPELAAHLPDPIEKLSFSCCGEPAFLHALHELGRRKVLLIGIECHVCVQQTAFDLLAHGYGAFLAVDAVGSRRETDKQWALHRLSQAGVALTTAESAVFEWTRLAGTPQFKEISKLVKGG